MEDEKMLVELVDDEIIFHSFSNPKVVSDFIKIILSKQNDLNRNLILNFKNISKGAYPNVCVPIATGGCTGFISMRSTTVVMALLFATKAR